MSKLSLTPGTTSQIVHVFIYDSTATTGAGKTALIHSDITAYYVRAGGTLTALTMETIATLGTWASTGDNYLGFKLLDDTNAPGVYELCLPNNILAAGSNQVVIQLRATGAAPCNIEIQLASIPSALQAILDTALTETQAGYLAAAFKKLFDVATPLLVASDVMRGTDGANTTVPDAAGTASTLLSALETHGDSTWATATGFMPSSEDGSSFTSLPAVTLADGAHGGSSASFAFGAGGSISNASGNALTLTSTGGNGTGLYIQGNGSGSGISGQGGTSGPGLSFIASGGPGVNIQGTTYGLYVNATAGVGAYFKSFATFDTIQCYSGASQGTIDARIPNVTLVDTTTTNTDMRGTDGANTTVPLDSSATQAAAAAALTSYDPPTKAEMEARTLLAASYATATAVAAVKTDTGNLVTRIPAALFTGITSLAQWLGLIAGKQTGNSTARTEIRATGAGSGTFDETADSLEAVRDRGDAAWTAGSSSVTITPLSSTVSAGQVSDTKITCYQYQAFGPYVLTITDSDDAAVDLSASDLVFRVYRRERQGVVLWTLTSTAGEITVGGASNNQVTLEDDDTHTEIAGQYRWVLWDATNDLVRGRGVLMIEAEAASGY